VIITVPQAKIKNHPKVAFGAIFADKAVLFQTVLVRPVVLAEAVSNHPYVDFRELCIGMTPNGQPKLPYSLKITRIT